MKVIPFDISPKFTTFGGILGQNRGSKWVKTCPSPGKTRYRCYFWGIGHMRAQKQKVCDAAMVIAVSRGKFQDLTERNYIFPKTKKKLSISLFYFPFHLFTFRVNNSRNELDFSHNSRVILPGGSIISIFEYIIETIFACSALLSIRHGKNV